MNKLNNEILNRNVSPKNECANSSFKWYWWLLISIILGVVITLFGAQTVSPLYEGYQFGYNEYDGTFFQFLGYSLANGELPYVDIFDHKGLFIFKIEEIGWKLAGKNGMFIICSIFQIINVYIIGIIISLFSKSKTNQILFSLLYGIIIICFKYGNHTGDLLMPFIFIPLYFGIKGIRDDDNTSFYLSNLFAGFVGCLGLLSRPTEGIWGGAFAVGYFVYYLYKRRDVTLLWNILLWVLGFGIPLSWACTYAHLSGIGIPLVFESTVLYNFNYVSSHVDTGRIIMIIITFFLTVLMGIGLLPIKKHYNKYYFVYFLTILILTGIINIWIARFPHYWLTAIPLFITILFLDSQTISFKSQYKRRRTKTSACWFLSVCSVILLIAYPTAYYMKDDFMVLGGSSTSTYKANKMCAEYLDKYIRTSSTFESDSVFTIDCSASVNLYLNKISPYKHCFYNSSHSLDNSKILTETADYLNGELIEYDKPSFVVVNASISLDSHPRTVEFYRALVMNYELLTITEKDCFFAIYEEKNHYQFNHAVIVDTSDFDIDVD